MIKNPNLDQRITSLLQSMFKVQQRIDDLLAAETGIGLSAFRILSVLDDKAASSQRLVAVELGQTEANVSRQLRHMADDGLVRIAPAKNDKRQRNVTRSAKGQKKYEQAEKLLNKNAAQISRQLKV